MSDVRTAITQLERAELYLVAALGLELEPDVEEELEHLIKEVRDVRSDLSAQRHGDR